MPEPKAEPEWVPLFLAALGACGNVTRSSALAGIDTTGPYNRRSRNPVFRDAWDQAVAEREARAAPPAGAALHSSERTSSGSPSASPSSPKGEEEEELSVSAGGARRVAANRWSKAAEELFLTELTVNANVQLAAVAAGFSAGAVYKRKARDRHFAAGWDAAIAVGRARLESFLIVQAERNFDPEALPIGEGQPKVTVSEALGILKHKPSASVAGGKRTDGYMDWVTDDDVAAMDDHEAAMKRIIDRLQRLSEREDRKKIDQGYRKVGEDWIPQGWVKG